MRDDWDPDSVDDVEFTIVDEQGVRLTEPMRCLNQ
jgi:hypothetical protein